MYACLVDSSCVFVCVCACVPAFVRTCVQSCVRAYVRLSNELVSSCSIASSRKIAFVCQI